MRTGMGVRTFRHRSNVWFAGVAGLVVAMFCSAAFGLDPMGPPMSTLRQGQYSYGVDYSYSKMDFELTGGTWVEHLDGTFFDAGDAESFTLKDFKMHKAYFTLGYGLADNAEVFFRLGGADANFGDSIWEDYETFESDTSVAVGGGIRATFYEQGKMKFGGLFQTSWTKFDGELWADHWVAADSVEIELMEIQAALGLTCELTEGSYIYGGPFFHYVRGELEDRFSEDLGGSLLSSKYSWDVEERSTLGGYVGLQVGLGGNASFNVEYLHTSSADAVCANLTLRF